MMDDGMDMPDESMDGEESEPATPAASVDDANAEEITPPPESTTAATDSDTIVVTGSRIKRTVFSSIAPLQVITAENSIKAGLIDPAQILQTSEAAAGTQIDATFQGFVLDNGPGSQTLNLRALDPQRTLILLNGRRLAPSGVEGAPVSPSINTIPAALVDRYDLLLDGASSIYGSDAVAGVVNVILRKDFDGFEVDGFVGTTEQGGNTDYTISGNWGGNTDRGFIGVGVEYDYRDEVTLADRDFLSDCEKHVEIDTNGNIRHRDIGDEVRFDVWFDGFQAADGDGPLGECVTDGISGRLFEDSGTFGSIYRVAGTETNIGLPGYVDQNLNSIPIDADGDGVQDYGFQEFSINGTRLDQSFISEQKRASIMSYGEYTFEGESNLTPFYEILYTDTRIFSDSGQPQLFPDVPATNPFNPCRSGVLNLDCGSHSFDYDDAFIQRWNTYYRDRDPNRDGDTSDARICATFAGGRFDNADCTPFLFGFGPSDIVGPTQVLPIVAIDGDRDKVDVTQKNLRFTAGVKGDLLFMNSGQFSNWTFDASVSHSVAKGTSDREGIYEARLNFALGVDPNTPFTFAADGTELLNPTPGPCMPNPGSPVTADVADGCVPVDLFNEAVALNTVGNFATAAERDYLFVLRRVETEYKQTLVQGYMTGNVASLPAGSIGAVIGGEVRIDEINTIPNDVAAEGLLFGFFSDSGVLGKKTTTEIYGELDIPLVADKTLFRQLDLNISGRITDDEFYGTNGTYSVKGGWRPFDSLVLKGSLGTSFRAPNLRENFLRPQSGFTNVFDPCVVPPAARGTGIIGADDQQVYVPDDDERDPSVLDICRREGVDPTSLGLNSGNIGTTQYEIFRIGSLDLDPETSKSISLGFAFEQPWTDAFDLDINASYYRLDLSNAIIELTGGFTVNSCYFAQEAARSQFCDNITRRGGTGFITEIDAGFGNFTQDLVRGVDYNIRFAKEFNAFDTPMELILNVRANQLIERSFSNQNDDGSTSFFEVQGEFGRPKWRGNIRADLDIDAKWNLSWTARFIDSVAQDPDFVDDFGDALGTSGNFADTCGGVFVGDVTCRDVGFADDYWVHAASLSYRTDTWLITAGASNIFNTDPPEVDGDEVFSISNVAIGNGYDLAGRRFFMSVRKSF
jgi:iron complex outermembrane receptor protein